MQSDCLSASMFLVSHSPISDDIRISIGMFPISNSSRKSSLKSRRSVSFEQQLSSFNFPLFKSIKSVFVSKFGVCSKIFGETSYFCAGDFINFSSNKLMLIMFTIYFILLFNFLFLSNFLLYI